MVNCACCSGVVAAAAAWSSFSRSAINFWLFSPGPLPADSLRRTIDAWKKKPAGAESAWPSAISCGKSISSPAVAYLHQRADMHLAVFSGRFDDRHHIFINPDIFGRFVGAGGNYARPIGAELHPSALRSNGFLPSATIV